MNDTVFFETGDRVMFVSSEYENPIYGKLEITQDSRYIIHTEPYKNIKMDIPETINISIDDFDNLTKL